jgi:hypothetical protein
VHSEQGLRLPAETLRGEQLIFALRRALEYRHLKLENRELQAQSQKAGETEIG